MNCCQFSSVLRPPSKILLGFSSKFLWYFWKKRALTNGFLLMNNPEIYRIGISVIYKWFILWCLRVFFGWGKSRLQILAPSKKGRLRNTAEGDEFFNVQYSVLDRFFIKKYLYKILVSKYLHFRWLIGPINCSSVLNALLMAPFLRLGRSIKKLLRTEDSCLCVV